MCNESNLVSSLANLYPRAFCQFMTGLMGDSVLCIFGKPLMVGVEGFKFLYFHLIFLYGLVTTVDRVFYYFLERTCRIIVYSDEVIV